MSAGGVGLRGEADRLLVAEGLSAARDFVEAHLLQEPGDAPAWRLLAELHRKDDDCASGLDALDKALALVPGDAGATLYRAQMLLDAGLPAVDAFAAAARLDATSGTARLGLAGALLAEGDGEKADSLIAQGVANEPGWVEGQAYLAKLRWMLGDPDHVRAFDQALAARPHDVALWLNRIALEMQADDHARALELVEQAEQATGPQAHWIAHRAACLDELGQQEAAGAAFGQLGMPTEPTLAVRMVRHRLRIGDAQGAFGLAEPWLKTPAAGNLWPYVSLAWRMLGDTRADWLEANPKLVGIYDIGPSLGDLGALADRLRALHHLKRQPIDQSLRGGTQTDGYLLTRLEPEFRKLRAVLAETVAAHIAQLGTRDPFHPTLRHRRDRPVAFSGAWSVRLAGGGYHVSHVHPLGWFSSALYIALPEPAADDPQAGWLALGEAEKGLGLSLPPLRTVEPKPGRLVLFPSTMWHGTRRFGIGERLTVAFDVTPPA
ncbi:MAG: putative 2OG-Fe(II) oxygenase [Novosphingobium sp.]